MAPSTQTLKHDNKPRQLGFLVNGLVNDIQQTKNAKYLRMKVSVDETFISVLTQQNGMKQGDFYSATLRGLSTDKYGRLSAFENERLV